MDSSSCSFDGCKNRRKHIPTGLCKPHRTMQLRGEPLRPLRPRSRLQSPTCTGPECSRPSEAHDLCKQHGQQLRKAGALHVIGDPAHRSAVSRSAWDRKSPEARTRHLAAMRAGIAAVRSEDHTRRQAEASRATWAGKAAQSAPRQRPCLVCREMFTVDPSIGKRQMYCSPECRRLYARLRRHGIGHEDYQRMLSQQGNACAVCRGAWRGWSGRDAPHIDHDHATGRVRGLLCGSCNTALGRFGDDPARLRRAADYIEANTAL